MTPIKYGVQLLYNMKVIKIFRELLLSVFILCFFNSMQAQITGVGSIGLTVSNMDRSVKFFHVG